MNIEPKSAALLEAQTGKFLLSHYPPARMSYIRMGRLVGPLIEATSPIKVDDKVLYAPDREVLRAVNQGADDDDFDELPLRYRTFLTRQSEESLEERRKIADYIARYDDFEPTIEHESMEMVGSGMSSHAYRIEVGGMPYVVRKIHHVDSLREVDTHLRAALRVQDIPHLEHVIAASYRNRETVAPYIEGQDLWDLSEETIGRMTQAQFDEFFTCFEQANERGVGFDGVGDNILYDEDTGFTAVDLALMRDFHTDAAGALYQNLTDNAERTVYEMIRGRAQPTKVKAIIKMSNMLAASLRARDESDYESMAERLDQRARDLAARLVAS